MNWAHALLMAELLLKAADKIDALQAPTDLKKEATMTENTPVETQQPVVSDPTTVTQSAEPAQAVDPATGSAPASATTQDIIASAAEQAPVASTQTPTNSSATTQQGGTTGTSAGTDTADAILKGISELLVLAKILDGNPDLFAFLKNLMSNPQSNQSNTTPT